MIKIKDSLSKSVKLVTTGKVVGNVTAKISPQEFRLEDTVRVAVQFTPENINNYYPISYEIHSPGFDPTRKYFVSSFEGGNLAEKVAELTPREPAERLSVMIYIYGGHNKEKIKFEFVRQPNGLYQAVNLV